MSQRLTGDRESDAESSPTPSPTAAIGRYDPVLEIRLEAMRALLARIRPGSDAEALRALRAAFPGSSLPERVAVLGHDPEGRARDPSADEGDRSDR